MDLSSQVKDALQEAIKAPPVKANSRSSALKEALDANQDLIRKALAQGHSVSSLAKRLKAAGIAASAETIRQHVKHFAKDNKNKATTTPKKAKATSAAQAEAASAASAASDSKAFEAEDRTA
jgi:hypothetical protein